MGNWIYGVPVEPGRASPALPLATDPGQEGHRSILVNQLLTRSPERGALRDALRLPLLAALERLDPVQNSLLWRSMGGRLRAEGRLTAFVPERYLGAAFQAEAYLQLLSASPCYFTLEELADEYQRAGLEAQLALDLREYSSLLLHEGDGQLVPARHSFLLILVP
jgi:hypothetical protein